jgi:hypothetical protein
MNLRRIAVVLSTALVVTATASVPAHAGYPDPGPSWIGMKLLTCDSPLDWFGGVPGFEYPSSQHPSGTVKLCWEIYKQNSQDPDFDLYSVRAGSTWTSTGLASGPATMFQEITSTQSAQDGAYGYSQTVVNDVPWCHSIDFDVSVSLVSFPVHLSLCIGGKVINYYGGPSGAGWYSPEAEDLVEVQTVFMQKVKKSTPPCFTVELGIPQYDTYPVIDDFGRTSWRSTSHIGYIDHTYCIPGAPPPGESNGPVDGSGGGTFPGHDEPAMVYDQGNASMKIYRWVSTGSDFGRLADYQSGAFHLSNVNDLVASGDVDGDGRDDIVMAYQNSDGTFSFHVFKRGSSWAGVWYTSGPFTLGPVASRLVVGDFNNDGRAEPALVRDNGDGTMRIYRWLSTGSSFGRSTD